MVTMFWLMLDLLAHPDYLAKARLQAQEALAAHGGQFSQQAIKAMTLFDAALKETVRLRAPPIILRATLRPVEFGPYVVPPGHFLCLSPQMSHRRHDMFHNATSWVPERWLAPNDATAAHRYSYLSFGSSLYRCPGQHYAYVQLVLIAAFLFSHFEFQLLDPVPRPQLDCLVGVSKPVSNVRVSFKKIKNLS